MSVSPTARRAPRHAFTSGQRRPPIAPKRPAELTLTLSIPLTGDGELSGPAHRLLAAARELIDAGAAAVVTEGASPRNDTASSRHDAGSGARAPRSARQQAVSLHAVPAPVPASLIEVHAASRTATVGGAPVPLTRLEFDLLLHLAENPRRVFTRAQLLGAVWGHEHAGVRTVDVHVRRLRLKIGPTVPLVTTVHGVGYRLADEADVEIDPTA
jgi:two-component system OmpR family response regulator